MSAEFPSVSLDSNSPINNWVCCFVWGDGLLLQKVAPVLSCLEPLRKRASCTGVVMLQEIRLTETRTTRSYKLDNYFPILCSLQALVYLFRTKSAAFP